MLAREFRVARLFAAASLLLLSACGGGGGGGGNSDFSSAGGLSISPTSLGFSAVQNGALPPTQSIQISVTDSAAYYVIGGVPAGSTIPSWLSMSLTGGGSNWSLNLQIATTSLAPGTYSATVRVVIARSDNTVIAYRDAQVTYTVRNSFSASPGSLGFNYVSGGALPAAQTVSVTANGATGWSATANQGWVALSATSGTTPTTISVTANPVGLASGTHNAVITFVANSSGATTSVNVTLTVLPPAITTSAPTLYFSYVRGAAVPAAQSVNVGGTNGLNWTANANQAWVTPSVSTGTTPSTISVGVDPDGLPAGIHTASVTFTSGVLSTVLNISLTVSNPVLNVSPTSLSFGGVAGGSLSPQSLNLTLSTGAAETWNASSGASWLALGQSTGTTPSTLSVGVNTSGLSAGTHSATITISGSGFWSARTINVTLTLATPTLIATPISLTFGGSSGHDMADKELTLSLNTGTSAHAWTISSISSWLQVIPSSGTVSASPASVTVRANGASLPAGTTNGTIVFAAQVGGTTVTRSVAVQANLDDHKVLASDVGVAFASTPSLSRLTRTLGVRSNRGAVVNWSATSNQAWLAVTPSGTTPRDIVLTADPSGLTADTLHYATVSISSDEPSVTNTEMIRIGFWVGTTTPSSTTNISGTFQQVMADPIRPYVYVHAAGTTISVYNIYTGGLVTTIPVIGVQLANMAISSDGSRLFVVDNLAHTIVPVNLPSFVPETGWTYGSTVSAYLGYVRTNGKGLVLSGNGRVFDAETGSGYSATFSGGYYGNAILGSSRIGNRFCAINSGISPYTVTCHSVDYSGTSGGQVLLGTGKQGEWGVGSNGQDLALSADGTRLYVASGAPYSCSVYDTTSSSTGMPIVQSLATGAYPSAARVGSDGKIFCGRSWPLSSEYGLFTYSSEGVELNRYILGLSVTGRGLAVSGDTLRATTIHSDLRITTVGP